MEKMRVNNYKPDIAVPCWIDEDGDEYHAPLGRGRQKNKIKGSYI